jgi:superfamily II DNA or RNA helicase
MDGVIPKSGDIARVRQRQYLVEEVIPPPEPGHQTLVRLSCLDDDAQGAPLEVLWEMEVDAQVLQGASWAAVARRGFDPPRLFSAYLHTLRWNCVTSTNPRLFQAPYRAGIEVTPYQLEPLRKALLLPRVNLFIADDVGLGKTIEAALILRELLMRQKVRRTVVACPPSVVLQWRDELESRFGLTFVVFDRDFVIGKRRERGYAVNPWTTHTRFIISHALLRDEAYAGPLRDWLGDFGPGSLLILDEAHNAAPASGAKYAIDSKLTRIVRDLAQRFEHRLFLSATPHNGHPNSFAALLEILDPQRFCRGVPVKSARLLDAVMVRRLKSDLREVASGFPDRRVIQIDIEGLADDAPELTLSHLVHEYARAREARLEAAAKSVQAASALIVTSLQKRLLSSIEAFACTLRVHRRAVERQAGGTPAKPAAVVPKPADLSLLAEAPGTDDERVELPEDQVQAEEEAQMELVSRATTLTPSAGDEAERLLAKERTLLAEMTAIAEAARNSPDPRIERLVAWIRREMCPDLPVLGAPPLAIPPKWNDRRVILFTEYTDTKRYLEQQLRAAIAGTDRAAARLASFHGGMDEESREEVKRAFNAAPGQHPLRILVATDAAREGVNLQNHCADLFHFDVPWNPSRMEQRNGRIDRKLQRAPEVRCYYFVLTQRPADRVLQTLVRKTDTIRRELGSLSAVLERRLAGLLGNGIVSEAESRLIAAIEKEDATAGDRATVEEELEAIREKREALGRQLDQLRDMLATSQKYLGLDTVHFRNAVSSALELLGAEPLKPVGASTDGEFGRWQFPALDRRTGADPSWVETLDTLRTPRRADQKPWEWRKESPVRPVVFRDSGTLDAEAVHLHLEHRVVQRLLGRFLAQGFVHDDLSRACLGQSDDPIPRVVLLGRLSLYGERAARLHDEIVSIAARWPDRDRRKDPLRPYADEAEARTLQLLETAMAALRPDRVSDAVRDRLLLSVERDVEDLLPHLWTRAGALAERASETLAARGEKEAKEMVEILNGQRTRIQTAFARSDDSQASFDFDEDERRQLEADRRHWQRRLLVLDEEVTREPARIRAGYVVRARRIEPVGIVYLWPVSG